MLRGLPRVAALRCGRCSRGAGEGAERSGRGRAAAAPRPPALLCSRWRSTFFFCRLCQSESTFPGTCLSSRDRPSRLLALSLPPSLSLFAETTVLSGAAPPGRPGARRPVPAPPRRSRSRSRRESGILPGCHLPGEEEADERAGAIYRHPKAQGKGELLWHHIPASALLFPLTESLALLWQCGKYIFFFFSPSPTPPAKG